MEPEINAIIQSRLKKLEILNEKGIDPYPTDFKPTHNTKDCLNLLDETEKKDLEKSNDIHSAGRITAIRKMGKAVFIDILDEAGKIQLLARNNTIDDATEELIELLDFNSANKLSGSRFVVLKGKLAQLQRALIRFMLDEATSNGYEEYYVPYIVNSESLIGTGQLPKFEDDQFSVGEGKYLIPTAEVPLTNILRNEAISVDDIPIKMTAHTPCFRAEAGSYGKDTRGMIRQHQFEKIELVKFVHPNESEKALDELVSHASKILDKLELSYRKVVLCSGDLGFSAAKTIDLEVWLPSQKCFREISSCSNFRDFQTRRMNTKIIDGSTKTYPHTLNGSALAVGRTLLAILENYYENGVGVHIPKVLSAYLTFDLIEIKK